MNYEIKNADEVKDELEAMTHLMADGSQERVEVINPRLDDHNPEYLRVAVPRKMLTFKVIRKAREFDLEVDDIWQLDRHYETERVCFKLVPRKDSDSEPRKVEKKGAL